MVEDSFTYPDGLKQSCSCSSVSSLVIEEKITLCYLKLDYSNGKLWSRLRCIQWILLSATLPGGAHTLVEMEAVFLIAFLVF